MCFLIGGSANIYHYLPINCYLLELIPLLAARDTHLPLFAPLDRQRVAIEELTTALSSEKSRAEHLQLALKDEQRQTEALKQTRDRAEELENINRGMKEQWTRTLSRRTICSIKFQLRCVEVHHKQH